MAVVISTDTQAVTCIGSVRSCAKEVHKSEQAMKTTAEKGTFKIETVMQL